MADSCIQSKRRRTLTRAGGVGVNLLQVALHGLVVALLAGLSGALFTSAATWRAFRWAWDAGEGLSTLAPGILAHVGLCALVWGIFWLSITRMRARWGQLRRTARGPLKLRQAGNVMTETLIILPVALILIMGIAQLTLVNIAGTLSDLAVIQAARTVWVWQPEATAQRFGVDRSLVIEKARVQAAAIVAPVASSDFGSFAKGGQTGYARTFKKTMGAIHGAQIEGGAGNDVGTYAQNRAELALSGDLLINTEDFSFFRAFDSNDFSARGARKFFNAWAAMEIVLFEPGDRVGVEMNYHFLCLMPLVAGVFGEYRSIQGDDGYYLTITRKYSLRKQAKVNEKLPLRL